MISRRKEVTAVLTLEEYLTALIGSLTAHAALAVYLFMMMEARGRQLLKKLPVLLLSPLAATLLAAGLYALFPDHGVVRYCISSCAVLLMCTLWVRWVWHIGTWRAFAATCMGGVFQVSASCLAQSLFQIGRAHV